MKPELQRIRIAKACGFDESHWLELKDGIVFGTSGSLPDYLNDLNAMHEAVRKLTDSQRTKFRQNLTKVWTARYNATHGLFPPHYDSVNASAKQRAEAFLRTLNLWIE
jgi:hypothetical protein